MGKVLIMHVFLKNITLGGGVIIMAFLKFFGRRKEAKRFDFPSSSALEMPPRPPVTEIEELPEVPEPEETLAQPQIEEYEAPAEGEFAEVGEEAEQSKEVHREDVIEVSETKPIFVKVGLYRNILNEVTLSGTVLRESESSLSRLNSVRSEEDSEFEKWRKHMNDIQRKLIYVDKILFD